MGDEVDLRVELVRRDTGSLAVAGLFELPLQVLEFGICVFDVEKEVAARTVARCCIGIGTRLFRNQLLSADPSFEQLPLLLCNVADAETGTSQLEVLEAVEPLERRTGPHGSDCCRADGLVQLERLDRRNSISRAAVVG